MKRTTVLGVFACCLPALPAWGADWYSFEFVAYRYLPEYGVGYVSDLNNAGRVGGWEDRLVAHVGIGHFGSVHNPGGVDTHMSQHFGINNTSDIAGATTPLFPTLTPNPAAYINGQLVSLGSSRGSAYDVNDARTVVGTGGGRGALWTWAAALNSFHTIVPGADATAIGRPRINAAGVVLASRLLYDPVGGSLALPPAFHYPGGLNDSGDIVGNNLDAMAVGTRASLRLASGQVISFSDMVAGRATLATGISNDGTVTLLVQREGNLPSNYHTMIWDVQHGLRDLNLMFDDPGHTYKTWLGESFSISDNGTILVHTLLGNVGSTQGYAVLTPVPGPGVMPLGAVSFLGVAFRRRARVCR